MCGFDNTFGIGITLSCAVDFQFNAEEAVAIAVENGIGLIVIVVDGLIFVSVVIT